MHMNNTVPTNPIRRSRSGDRLTRFVFTLNNYTDEEYGQICSLDCRWIIVGKETGENNTPHLQGAVILNHQLAFNSVKRLSGFERAHIEKMRGTPADSAQYCSKQDSTPFINGTMPQPGKRNDLLNVVGRIKAGETLRDLATTDDEAAVCIVKYHKGLTILRALQAPPRNEPPVVLWLYGATGTGKTKSAFDLARDLDMPIWISHGNLQWFDGYDGQPVVVFDDYRTRHSSFSYLLRLLDRYPISVPFKGGFTDFQPRYIIVTAPQSPTDMWSYRTPEQLQQLTRRITLQLQYTEEDAEPLISELSKLDPPLLDNGDALTPTQPLTPYSTPEPQILIDLTKTPKESKQVLDCAQGLIDLTDTPVDSSLDCDSSSDSDEECISCYAIDGCCEHNGKCGYKTCIRCDIATQKKY